MKNGTGVYLDDLNEAKELLEKKGHALGLNSKIPTCPGVYWSVKLNRWLMVGYGEGYEVVIMTEGDLEDVLELFEATLP